MPAETIKDCLGSGLQVPKYFVVPTVAFVRQLGPNIGLNVAEFEFPAYCNFFFYQRRVCLIVATKEVEKRIRKVFQETLFGPDNCDVSGDFKEGTPKDQMPDMQKELDMFRVFNGKKMQVREGGARSKATKRCEYCSFSSLVAFSTPLVSSLHFAPLRCEYDIAAANTYVRRHCSSRTCWSS